LNPKYFLPIIMIVFLITACGGADVITPPPPDEPVRPTSTSTELGARVGEEFTLGEGESIWIEKGLFEITLGSVIEDSRCPANAECFWAGNAKVEVMVGAQSYILTLGELLDGDQNLVDLGDGYTLRALQITPYPGSEEDGQPYQITLVVERETSQPHQYPDAV
jgi:hypothetical protein